MLTKKKRRLQIIATICLFIPLGILTSFAVTGLSAVKDSVQRTELIKQTKILNNQISAIRDHLRTAKTHLSIAKTTLDVIGGRRSIWSVFHFSEIIGWEPYHLVWNLKGLYSDISTLNQVNEYYGSLLNSYQRVINDYTDYKNELDEMTFEQKRNTVQKLEAKKIENKATVIIQTEAISESLGNKTREEINDLATQLTTDTEKLTTNDLLTIIASTNLINTRIASHHLLLYATVENKQAEAAMIEQKITDALSITTTQ